MQLVSTFSSPENHSFFRDMQLNHSKVQKHNLCILYFILVPPAFTETLNTDFSERTIRLRYFQIQSIYNLQHDRTGRYCTFKQQKHPRKISGTVGKFNFQQDDV